MLRNGSYCEAQHLVSTEPLMTFDKNRISKKLYRWNSCDKKKNIVNHKVASIYIIDNLQGNPYVNDTQLKSEYKSNQIY